MSWLVTGTGAVCSVGRGTDAVFEALCSGTTGLNPLRSFEHDKFRVTRAYEVDDRDGGADVPGRATAWLLDAIAEALADAGLGEDLSKVPVLVGTGLRELRSVELWWAREDAGPGEPDRLHFGTALRERFGATDTYTFSNACSASLYALALATDLLTVGGAETVVVAGVDGITTSMHGLLDRVHPEPPEAVRPFDRERKGVLMGEGAAAVVLRKPDGVDPTAAKAVLRAVGLSCDAFHVTAPDPAGIAASVRQAHARAGIKPEDVDLVMLHGTGTLLNDEAEAAAVAEVFGEHAGAPVMTAVKSMTGHTSGGSGLLGLVLATRALAEGRVPPTVGLVDPVPEAADFRFARAGDPVAELSVAQVDAFGFGGVNAVAVIERTSA
ncbi:beta-ketoacyl synthase N-terminal-like domain-containing protein [Saccharothrix algeriensis]|uniref:3-oxoacyl-ACP synthase n=1 Tax=Saccharothrix algeriensis TaxID=173560 RepID=A0A8T8I258_9PSEU|nr:beta-ketoacyl synthase N-terminal-like domain-containing protein [Saccharothrix algeriensis]MBM7810382.1 3-oxoacyl-[acyl-carrier-protein] synthase II [Saccharothrix algeriensis]QTR04520.1 3-oxoacyl-ACP synthase [Saccharothrix algeriensis]